MKNIWRKIYTAFCGWLETKPLIILVVWSLALNCVVELLCRHRQFPAGVAEYILDSPLIFLYNVLILMATLSLMLLFRRRLFVLTAVTTVWLGLAIANFAVLTYRETPFSYADVLMLYMALRLVDVYVSPLEMALGGLALLAAVFGMVMLWRKGPKVERRHYRLRHSVPVVAGLLACLVVVTTLGRGTAALTVDSGDLSEAYDEYGFPYGFASTFSLGIERPYDYSPRSVEKYIDGLDAESDEEKQVNIIFLQLESFFDPYTLTGLEFSEDPIPVFHALQGGASGCLTVPSLGGATCNTEFEIITGMSTKFFGVREYPYNTVLTGATCESMAYDVKKAGYTAHAIHDYYATYYGRDTVYANLGFDTFTSLEYMSDVDYDDSGWARDRVLTRYIIDALESTEGADFVQAVSVQGHGSYDSDFQGDYTVNFEELYGERGRGAFEHYLQKLHEMDTFLGELLSALEARGEPVLLIAYGDHLPAISIEQDALSTGSLYKTEYVLWSNCGIEPEDRDIEAYRMAAWAQELTGLSEGVVMRYHQQCAGEEDYLRGLETLQYDMLYGESYSLSGVKYQPSALRFGVKDAVIRSVEERSGGIIIFGDNFTEYSTVYIDDRRVEETEFISESELYVPERKLYQDDWIEVHQMGADAVMLGKTPRWIITD